MLDRRKPSRLRRNRQPTPVDGVENLFSTLGKQLFGQGVSEMRVDVGPGYRIYFVGQGVEVYVLLVGGDKSSQKRDIQIALAMARELKQERDPHEH